MLRASEYSVANKDESIQVWSSIYYRMDRAGRYDNLGVNMTCARPLSSWPSGTAFTRDINTILIRRLDSRGRRQRALLWGLTTHHRRLLIPTACPGKEEHYHVAAGDGLWLYPNGLRGLLPTSSRQASILDHPLCRTIGCRYGTWYSALFLCCIYLCL